MMGILFVLRTGIPWQYLPQEMGCGSKRHLLTDGQGVPLAVKLTCANTNDCQMVLELLDAVPPIRRPFGKPRKRPCSLVADKAYDWRHIRTELRRRRIEPRTVRRGWPKQHGLGRLRWVVERTLAWLGQFRRLRIRYERRPEIHEAFLTIGCALICWNFIQNWFC